jgi:hypothetical protein
MSLNVLFNTKILNVNMLAFSSTLIILENKSAIKLLEKILIGVTT